MFTHCTLLSDLTNASNDHLKSRKHKDTNFVTTNAIYDIQYVLINSNDKAGPAQSYEAWQDATVFQESVSKRRIFDSKERTDQHNGYPF